VAAGPMKNLAGIIDPTKVIGIALENAVWRASSC
jgi:hypothetical protein